MSAWMRSFRCRLLASLMVAFDRRQHFFSVLLQEFFQSIKSRLTQLMIVMRFRNKGKSHHYHPRRFFSPIWYGEVVRFVLLFSRLALRPCTARRSQSISPFDCSHNVVWRKEVLCGSRISNKLYNGVTDFASRTFSFLGMNRNFQLKRYRCFSATKLPANIGNRLNRTGCDWTK